MTSSILLFHTWQATTFVYQRLGPLSMFSKVLSTQCPNELQYYSPTMTDYLQVLPLPYPPFQSMASRFMSCFLSAHLSFSTLPIQIGSRVRLHNLLLTSTLYHQPPPQLQPLQSTWLACLGQALYTSLFSRVQPCGRHIMGLMLTLTSPWPLFPLIFPKSCPVLLDLLWYQRSKTMKCIVLSTFLCNCY